MEKSEQQTKVGKKPMTRSAKIAKKREEKKVEVDEETLDRMKYLDNI